MHVAAPTSLADDARYRAQVHAISRASEQFPVAPSNPAEDLIGPNRLALDPSPDILDSPISVIPDSQPESIPHEPAHHRPKPQPRGFGGVERDPLRALSPSLHNFDLQRVPPIPLPQEIHPPLPPISTVPFSTHVTPTLAMLTRRLHPARTYNPLLQTRALDQLERGYWLMHITLHDPQDPPAPGLVDATNPPNTGPKSWDTPSFHRFWSFLAEFVGKEARAGWGVWCVLEQDQLVTSSGTTGSSLPARGSGSVSVVLKVYAWGEVAMHVYLLLYLASERRIRGMGAEWRDSSEKTIIQMPCAP